MRCRRASRSTALRRFCEPFLRRATIRCARCNLFSAFRYASGPLIRPCPEIATVAATPRSIPIAGRVRGAGSVISYSYWIAANHCPASQRTVTFLIWPGNGRQPRKRTHPSLGSFRRPPFPVRRSYSVFFPSGNRKESPLFFFLDCGNLARWAKSSERPFLGHSEPAVELGKGKPSSSLPQHVVASVLSTD